ncbi:MAG: hypothetical protein LUG16_02140 [Candidatus Gastranaerophilales bacterium]|nr:hypothetical protein [Candidatus Gastranaerophilales bacterium]
MKVNSINSLQYMTNTQSFKHSAVPYPEYQNAYEVKSSDFTDSIDSFIGKIADLFNPKASKEAAVIKSEIDDLYDDDSKKTPKEHLLSVFA